MLTLLRKLRSEQHGAALVTVVALLAISMVVVAVIGTSVFAASSVTVTSRASVQSKASAEAGIDWALGEFNRGYFPCAGDYRTSNPSFQVNISYVNAANAALTCGVTASGSPAKATIISTGYSAIGSTTTAANTHQVGAVANIVLATSGTVLDQALFTESALDLTNNSQITGSAPGVLDGNVYTNGAFDCRTQNRIEGTIFARGDVTVWNTCAAMASVWAGGNVNLRDSDVRFDGDLYAAGNADINKAHITGNVVVNGYVKTTDRSNTNCGSGGGTNVCGSIWSLNNAITLGNNGTPVAGSLYARNGITLSGNDQTPRPASAISLNGTLTMQGSRIAGTVAIYGAISSSNPGSNITKANTCSVTVQSSQYWTTCTGTLTLPKPATSIATYTPAASTNLGTRAQTVAVDKPPRQSFPQIFSSTTAISTHWSGWQKPVVPAAACTSSSSFQSQINTILAGYSSGTKVLLQMPCTSQVPGDNVTLNLKGDVAFMVPKGVNWGNETKINSSGGPWTVMFIVPSDAPGVTWSQPDPTGAPGQLSPSCSGVPDLYFSKLVVNNSSRVFMYTPCKVSIQNRGNGFEGQIYSGTAGYQDGIIIKRGIMTIPGVEVPGQPVSSSSTSATIISRYDVG